ncbi:MAG: hypothetical protein HY000_30305 [Planctomycetes bacterium]|nr:hypothetical protein [Planctomycetota bacterium]
MKASLDRINLTVQQLSTTLRVPIGQPVLVGGMTLHPEQDNGARLYLFVQAIVAEEPN